MKNTITIKVQTEKEIEVTFPTFRKSRANCHYWAIYSKELYYQVTPHLGEISKNSGSFDYMFTTEGSSEITKSEYFTALDLTIKNSEALFAELYDIMDVEDPNNENENVGFEYNPITEQMQ